MTEFPLDFWHFELTSRCPIGCPRCSRTEQAGDYWLGELSFDTIKRIFTPAFIRQKLMKITFCGGQGDPIYHSKFLEIYKYFKSHNPNLIIATVTNGSHRSKEWWQELRSMLTPSDEIIFSIDGYDDDSNRKYRINSDWDSIMDGIEILRGGPATLIWSTIIFKFNQHHLGNIVSLARGKGIDRFHFVQSNLFGKYLKKYIDPQLGYDPLEPDYDYVSEYLRSVKYSIEFRDKKDLRYKKSGIAHLRYNVSRAKRLEKLLVQTKEWPVLPSCLISYYGIYVDAEGIIYPCSWTSHPVTRKSKINGRVLEHKDSLWVKQKNQFDLNERTLKQIMEDPVWHKLTKGWTDGKSTFIECEKKCSRQFYTKQFNEKILRFLGDIYLNKLKMLDQDKDLLAKIMNAKEYSPEIFNNRWT